MLEGRGQNPEALAMATRTVEVFNIISQNITIFCDYKSTDNPRHKFSKIPFVVQRDNKCMRSR